MGTVDIVVIVILSAALLGVAGYFIYRKVKHKGSGCDCGCDCASCSMCHKKK